MIAYSCWTKEENLNPAVQFLNPKTELLIDKDTIVTFLVEAVDEDGTIDRVDFSINGELVHTVIDPPFEFEWNIYTEENIGFNVVRATAYDDLGAKTEVMIQIEIKSYLSKCLGFYKGTSHHWSSYPNSIPGPFIENHAYKKVQVSVAKAIQDSCLDLNISYNDSIINYKKNLFFSPSGIHSSQWGGGSGYGSLEIEFDSDTLYYRYFQKCGIPCNSGIEFESEKL